jgi:signal recognition particle subunit SRP68
MDYPLRQISAPSKTTPDSLLASTRAQVRPHRSLNKQADARVFSFKASRCFYLALQYAGDKKAAEALALLERCGEHAEAALAHHNICKNQNKSLISKVEKLQRDVRGWRCYLQARAFMASSNLASSGEISASTLAPGGLLANLDKYDASYLDEKLIVEFPPGFEAIACKPVLFDLALSAFQPPDLSEKKKAPKGGFFSSFWG